MTLFERVVKLLLARGADIDPFRESLSDADRRDGGAVHKTSKISRFITMPESKTDLYRVWQHDRQ